MLVKNTDTKIITSWGEVWGGKSIVCFKGHQLLNLTWGLNNVFLKKCVFNLALARKEKHKYFHSARPLGQAKSWFWCVCLCDCMFLCLFVCLSPPQYLTCLWSYCIASAINLICRSNKFLVLPSMHKYSTMIEWEKNNKTDTQLSWIWATKLTLNLVLVSKIDGNEKATK